MDLARLLLKQFSPTFGVDPMVFLPSIVTVMTHYPREILEAIVDPFSGLPGKQDKMPTPHQVKQACEALYATERARYGWEKRAAEQRAVLEADAAARAGPRQTIEEIEDEMAQRGILMAGYRARHARAPLSPGEREAIRANLGPEKFDATPEA